MTIKDDEILGAGGRGGAGGGNPEPYGFMPESYYDWSGQTDTTTTLQANLHGTSWGDGEYGVGEGGRQVICIACDGTQTKWSGADWTSDPTTDVLMTVTGLKPAYAYIVRGYAQNNRYYTYYSPISRPAWMTNVTSATTDLSYNITASVTGVWKDKVEVTAKGNTGNTLTASCKIYYADVTDFNTSTLTFSSTSAKSVANTGSQVFTITGLTPGHDYIFSLQKTASSNTVCDRPNWVRLPSLTTDTTAQKVTDTGWQTLYEELMYGNQRRNVVTATRLNNTVTLNISEQFRHAAFPTRYSGMDFNITGEDIYSMSFWVATTLKSSSIFQSGSQESWLTLGSFAANDTLSTPLTVTRSSLTKTVEPTHTVISMAMGYQDYNSNYSSDFWTVGYYGGTPLYVPIPAAGTPAAPTFSNGSVSASSNGSTIAITMTGTSWGDNCTGGDYVLAGAGYDSYTNPTVTDDVDLTYTGSGAIGSHNFSYTSSYTNCIYSLAGGLENDAGIVYDGWNSGIYTDKFIAITSPAAPSVALVTNDGSTASFSFTGQSNGAIAPESYYWRLGSSDSWHAANEIATGLTRGQTYTVQVKATSDINSIDWEALVGENPPEGLLIFGGGDSAIVNGLTFTAGGEVEIPNPAIWAKHGLSNEKVGHLFVKVNGQKKRLSKVYVKVDNENRLIFRDYFGAYDTVDTPTIISFVADGNYKTATINIIQSVDEGTVVDWGDGSEKVLPSGVETTITLTHTYTNNGDYDIVLTPLKSSMLEILTISGGRVGPGKKG